MTIRIFFLVMLCLFTLPLFAGEIHIAVSNGDQAAVERLLTADPTLVSTLDERQETPLMLAAEQKNLAIVTMLITHGADVQAKQRRFEYTALHNACDGRNAGDGKDQCAIITLLLEKGANINATDFGKQTPLYRAVSVEVASLLLEHGADVNARDIYGSTRLFHILSLKELATWYLAHGADVTIRDRDGRTLLYTDMNPVILALLTAKKIELDSKDNAGMTALCYAAQLGHVELLNALLTAGADINATDKQGDTALHYAARRGELAGISALIEHGASVKLVNARGETPLIVAASSAPAAVLDYLLAHGAEIPPVKDGGSPILFAAMRYANRYSIERINWLLAKGCSVTATNERGWTPLHMAVAGSGNKEMILLLLEKGADVNARGNDGITPLGLIFSRQTSDRQGRKATVDLLRLLLEKGADPNLDTQLLSSMCRNAGESYPETREMIDLLTPRMKNVDQLDKGGRTPLTSAVQNANIATMKMLLTAGADISAKNKDGDMPIHIAPNVEILQLLLDHGASANALTSDGQTPLFHAAQDGAEDRVALLLKHGVDVNKADKTGVTALHLCLQGRKGAKVLPLLLDAGANVNAATDEGKRPLHYAAQYGTADMAALLIAKGAEVNAGMKNGNTPLHYTRSAEVAQVLLEHGAAINAQGVSRWTPLAATQNMDIPPALTELLLAHGADLNIKDQDGCTAAFYVRRADCAALFTAKGCDWKARLTNGWTILHHLSERSLFNSDLITYLVKQQGLDPNARDNIGRTPLHLAAFYGCEPAVQGLLANGADPNAHADDGSTPLSILRKQQRQNLIDMVVKAGGKD